MTAFVIIITVFLLIFLLLNFILREQLKLKECQNTLYECGFDNLYWFYNKIRVHFFKIGLVFILFDLEMIYLILVINNIEHYYLVYLVIIFILFTLILEVFINSLVWNF